MEIMKPEIMIGLYQTDEHDVFKMLEVSYGIEEEGCLCRVYEMEHICDIRYTPAETAVVITDNAGTLVCCELNRNDIVYSVKDDSPEVYRILGSNAARYIKKLKFKGI